MHAAERKSWRQHQIFSVYSFHTNQFMSGALASFRRLERMAAFHPLLKFKPGYYPPLWFAIYEFLTRIHRMTH